MALIYITGISGAGKSTVLIELNKRGYEVHDADEHLSAWENKVTRERISNSNHKIVTSEDFFKNHDWYIDKAGTVELAKMSIDKTIFLGGSVANEDEVWSAFDKVFCLYVDDEIMKSRVMNRTEKDFGKSEHELDNLFKLNANVPSKYHALGATVIDATQPVDSIVDQILSDLKL